MSGLKNLQIVLLLAVSNFLFSQESKWTHLLDANLSQWEMYLSYRHKPDYKGEIPVDEKGEKIAPIGYNKNEANVFSMIEENKEPVLKVSGEIYGCVFTKQEYENYHLKLQVKWGDKKWMPRTDKLRDTGILYHSVGECGIDYWRAWMLSQELQIMEGHVGDYWNIANSAIDVRAFIPEGIMNPVANENQPFLPIAAGTGIDGFCLRSENYESKPEAWTTVELICYGDKSLHIVNGKVVMVLQNSRYVKDGKSYPLVKGKIQLQSEGAEVYFKDVKIKGLNELPKGWKAYFE